MVQDVPFYSQPAFEDLYTLATFLAAYPLSLRSISKQTFSPSASVLNPDIVIEL